jgi:hypothetical protein
MAFNFSRYTKIYQKLVRPDVAQAFPRHVFVREPNYPSFLDYSMEAYIPKRYIRVNIERVYSSPP